MKNILGGIHKANKTYGMIAPGDIIAVGVSGGKDSMVLLEGLVQYQKFMGVPFEIKALTIDPCFNNKPGDYRAVEAYCRERKVSYTIHPSQLYEIIFQVRKEKNPCGLCSRMRRGMLHNLVLSHGCNKLALGHHQDDAVETLILNLFRGGRLGCFQPVTYLSRKNITMIRPLILLPESRVVEAGIEAQLPLVKSDCPVDGKTAREDTKQWIKELEKGKYPVLGKNLFNALLTSQLEGWGPEDRPQE